MTGHLNSSWTLFGLLFGCFACSGKSERDHIEPTLPLVPGTCVNTDCSWPVVEMHEPATLVTCVPADGQPVEVVWSQEAAQVACGSEQCFALPSDVAAGATGEVWTTAQLLEDPFADSEHPVGLELRRNAPTGALELERITHAVVNANASGMSVSLTGELDWVGPSPETTGLSLLHYDRMGNETSASWLIQHATRSTAHFGPHGITVVYEYLSAVEGSDVGEDPDSGMGVARFDAKGSKLEWNQAFSHAGVPFHGIALVGVGHAGDVEVILERDTSWEGYGGTLLLQLAADGHVAWARELGDSPSDVFGFNPTDESLLLAGWLHDEDGPSRVAVEGIDHHGDSNWRASFEATYALAMTVSDAGEAWIYGAPIVVQLPGDPDAFFSINASSCTKHPLELELGLSTGNGSWMDGLVFAPLPNNHVAFASSGRYGVLALP